MSNKQLSEHKTDLLCGIWDPLDIGTEAAPLGNI